MLGTLRRHSRSSRSIHVSFSTAVLRKRPLPQANESRREWTRSKVVPSTKAQAKEGAAVLSE